MKNKIMGWGGFLIIVGFFFVHFGVLNNENNDQFWRDRKYTLIEKHPGAHEYKGKVVEDHYVTIQYSDEPNTLWTREVSGASYYSMDEGKTYSERGPKDEKLLNRLNLALIAIGFFGIVIMSIGIANSMEFESY